MFCPNCGTENPEGSKFCQKCGMRLEASSTNSTNGSEGAYDSIWNDNQNGANGAGQSQQEQNPNDPWQTQDPFASQGQNVNDGQQGPYYGNQQGSGYGQGNNGQPPKKRTGMAIASLVLGIIGIVLFFMGGNGGLILGIIGLPLAIYAKKKGDQSTVRKAGFITSLISLILGIIMVILQIVGVSILTNSLQQDSTEDEYEVIEETEEEETETEEETIEETEETVAETEETEAETEEETQAATENMEITFESMTAVDNDDCSIVITGVVENEWGCTLTVELENKTTDQTLTFTLDDAYLNGLYYYESLYEDVTAGNKSVVTLEFNDTADIEYFGVSDLSTIGLGAITDIELIFEVYNEDYDDVAYESAHVYPYGEENATAYVRESADTDVVLVDNEDLTFTVVGCEYDESWEEYQVDVFIENKTDVQLTYYVDEASVNDYMASPWWGTYISAGCCSYATIYWSADDLAEIGISDPESEIESIELDLEVYDESYNDVYTETLTWNP